MADTIPAPLKGKVAVITGGSRGIGAGIAQAFARHGCTHIAITYMSNHAAANKSLDAIRAINSTIKTCAFAADVRDPECGRRVVEQALQGLETEHIDIMVSNAALLDIQNWPPVETLGYAQWNDMLTSEAWTPLALAREAVKTMPRGGRIILLSSTASKMPLPDPMLPYGAAKAALDSVSRCLAAIYGVRYGVTVNSISVGYTKTDSSKAVGELWGEAAMKAIEESSLLKRGGEVEDVAEIVAFVASPQAGWMTGNAVPANGGALAMVQG